MCMPEPLKAGEPFGWYSDMGREQLNQPPVTEADCAGEVFDRWLAVEAERVHRECEFRGQFAASGQAGEQVTFDDRQPLCDRLRLADLRAQVGRRAVPHCVEIDMGIH